MIYDHAIIKNGILYPTGVEVPEDKVADKGVADKVAPTKQPKATNKSKSKE